MPTIAIVAPSGYAPEPANVARAIERLQARGWAVKNFVNHAHKFQRFAADDASRLAQLYQAADDSEAGTAFLAFWLTLILSVWRLAASCLLALAISHPSI